MRWLKITMDRSFLLESIAQNSGLDLTRAADGEALVKKVPSAQDPSHINEVRFILIAKWERKHKQ